MIINNVAPPLLPCFLLEDLLVDVLAEDDTTGVVSTGETFFCVRTFPPWADFFDFSSAIVSSSFFFGGIMQKY